MRYLVQAKSRITEEWFQIYANDVRKNAEDVKDSPYVQNYFLDARVIDTEEE